MDQIRTLGVYREFVFCAGDTPSSAKGPPQGAYDKYIAASGLMQTFPLEIEYYAATASGADVEAGNLFTPNRIALARYNMGEHPIHVTGPVAADVSMRLNMPHILTGRHELQETITVRDLGDYATGRAGATTTLLREDGRAARARPPAPPPLPTALVTVDGARTTDDIATLLGSWDRGELEALLTDDWGCDVDRDVTGLDDDDIREHLRATIADARSRYLDQCRAAYDVDTMDPTADEDTTGGDHGGKLNGLAEETSRTPTLHQRPAPAPLPGDTTDLDPTLAQIAISRRLGYSAAGIDTTSDRDKPHSINYAAAAALYIREAQHEAGDHAVPGLGVPPAALPAKGITALHAALTQDQQVGLLANKIAKYLRTHYPNSPMADEVASACRGIDAADDRAERTYSNYAPGAIDLTFATLPTGLMRLWSVMYAFSPSAAGDRESVLAPIKNLRISTVLGVASFDAAATVITTARAKAADLGLPALTDEEAGRATVQPSTTPPTAGARRRWAAGSSRPSTTSTSCAR